MSGHTVLIVEDEPLIRMALSEHLQDLGFQVLEAASAAEAMTVMDRHRGIDLVFSDVRMPGEMDGIGLARWILKHWPGMPVMLTSGELSRVKAVEELSEADNFSTLAKPYRYVDVCARMVMAIERKNER